jgi:hypothetical protein
VAAIRKCPFFFPHQFHIQFSQAGEFLESHAVIPDDALNPLAGQWIRFRRMHQGAPLSEPSTIDEAMGSSCPAPAPAAAKSGSMP